MKRRYMALFLVALLLPCCIAVPALAAEPAVKAEIVNLLNAESYKRYVDGDYYGAIDSPKWYSSGTNMAYYWTPTTQNVAYSSIYFTIQSSAIPSSVQVQLYSGYSPTAEYLGSDGGYRYYRAPGNATILDFGIIANFSSSVSQTFAVISCIGVVDMSSHISSVDIRSVAFISDKNVNTDFISVANDDNASLPVFVNYAGDFSAAGTALFSGETYITISSDQRELEFADSITFVVTSVGESFFDASLISSDHSFYTALDIEVDNFQSFSTLHAGPNSYPIWGYKVTVNLSGYELSGYEIMLHFETDELQFDDTLTTEVYGFFATVDSIYMTPVYESVAWYVEFYHWIRDSLSSGFNSVVSSISSWGQNIITGLGDKLTEVKNTVATWGKNIVDAIIPDTGQADQVVDDAVSKGDQIGDLNDQMNSVERPDLSGSGDISGIISPGDLSSSTTFLTTVVNAPYIGQVIMLSLILSLAAYVLFGKRA